MEKSTISMAIFNSYVSLLEGNSWYLAKNWCPLKQVPTDSQPPPSGRAPSCSEAMNVFESLKKSGAEMNSVVYNTVLDVGN